ncbi:MAG: C40 family peptidase [Lachnospiraceae bacterium]|nr:C40 family peptidase [Lachnospiraceae bacterium]
MRKRSYLYKRILSALLVGTLLLGGVGTAAYASQLEDAKDKRDEAQKNLDKVNKEIEKLNKAQDELQAEMEAYDEELMALLTDLVLLGEDIDKKEAEIHQAEDDLEAAEIREAEQYASMKLRIQYMYENSNQSLWTTLLASDNFTDALNRAEYIADVYEYDRNQLTEYQETVQQVTDLKAKLDEEMIALGELQVNMEEQQGHLENLLAESAAKMENMQEQIADASALAKKYAKTIKQQNQFIATEEARIAAEKAAAAAGNSGGVTGGSNPSYSTNVSGQDVVNYASQFVGNPYVYGGTSLTNGCDCSYFTQACFGHFGISLPRTSYAQRSSGQAVSYSNAKAGDIICYAGHVAIYMGNGKIVHAANAKNGICYGNATYRDIITIRRVL